MPDLISPNGVPMCASDEAAPRLLVNGWLRVNVVADTDDLSALTVAQLRELCAGRGIEAPKRATKAQLVALLGE